MTKTLYLIRCVDYTTEVERTIQKLESLTEAENIKLVIDKLSGKSLEQVGNRSESPIGTLEITSDFVDSNGLHFFGDPARTGWACGDYVIYRALELEWDFAWVIEPDVGFQNGSIDTLVEPSLSGADLICADFQIASESWYWRKRVRQFFPNWETHSMAFPLVRVSRSLAQECLRTRQSITEKLDDKVGVPNDESVVASTAANGEFSVVNLRKHNPRVFSKFSTTTKYSVSDIEQLGSQPRIVHSLVDDEEFMRYLTKEWKSLGGGGSIVGSRFYQAAKSASKETMLNFLIRLSDLETAKS